MSYRSNAPSVFIALGQKIVFFQKKFFKSRGQARDWEDLLYVRIE
jgi:hypothetical protein